MKLLHVDVPGLFWCWRCGAIKQVDSQGVVLEAAVPKLVDRCRKFADSAAFGQEQMDVWRAVGIEESIGISADRKNGPWRLCNEPS